MLIAVAAAGGDFLYLHRSTDEILPGFFHPLFGQKADKCLPCGFFNGGAQIVGTDMELFAQGNQGQSLVGIACFNQFKSLIR